MKKPPATFRPQTIRPCAFGPSIQPEMRKASKRLKRHFPQLGATTAYENTASVTSAVEHPHRGHVVDEQTLKPGQR